jgi:hypothetical protein
MTHSVGKGRFSVTCHRSELTGFGIRHAATVEEFGFLVVNETHALVRYRQAILWRRTAASQEGKVVAVSGIALPDADAPFLVWLRKVLKTIGTSREIEPVDARQVPPGLAVEWVDWLPPHGLWVPLDRSEDERLGGLPAPGPG